MATLAAAVICAGLALSLIMALAWVIQQRSGNSGWIDACWTFGTGLVAAGLALAPLAVHSAAWRQVLIAAMVASWSMRLGWHIVERTRRADDDPRYRAIMKQWGAAAPRKLFWFLQAQAAVALVLACAVMSAAHGPERAFSVLDAAGIALFFIGFGIEALSDVQLRKFKQSAPPRAVCDVGLWAWSRHPNYFGEWLCWCAYPLLAFGSGYWLGAFALIGPAIMYWTLVHASGIPPLEAHMRRTRPQAWAVYARRTSAFFPLPPKA